MSSQPKMFDYHLFQKKTNLWLQEEDIYIYIYAEPHVVFWCSWSHIFFFFLCRRICLQVECVHLHNEQVWLATSENLICGFVFIIYPTKLNVKLCLTLSANEFTISYFFELIVNLIRKTDIWPGKLETKLLKK